MPNPSGNLSLTPAGARHERYYAIIETFQAWCEENELSFCVEMAHLCQDRMGVERSVFKPTNDRRDPPPPRSTPVAVSHHSRHKRKVYTSTGETHPSVAAAARSINVSPTALRYHLGAEEPYFGCRWSYSPFPNPTEERAA